MVKVYKGTLFWKLLGTLIEVRCKGGSRNKAQYYDEKFLFFLVVKQ